MNITEDVNTVEPQTARQWRAWLENHHRTETGVWLVMPHRSSGRSGIGHRQAVEQALCFGWIDSLHRKHDRNSSRLRFSPRKPGSRWSEINRGIVAELTEQGLMTDAGQAVVDAAKADGTWQLVPDSLPLPADLAAALNPNTVAAVNFSGFSRSARRGILEWIATAKRPETRRRRIDRTVELAARNIRADRP